MFETEAGVSWAVDDTEIEVERDLLPVLPGIPVREAMRSWGGRFML